MRPVLPSEATAGSEPTPGPWTVYDINPVIVLADRYSGGGFAVATCCPVRKVTQEQAEANARLIAEAGTVHHETGLTPQQMREQISRLEDDLNRQKAKTEYEAELRGNALNDLDQMREQRDELLAALRGVVAVADRKTDEFNRAHEAIAKAEAA